MIIIDKPITANDKIIPQVEAFSFTPRTSTKPPSPPKVMYTVRPAPSNADITAPKFPALFVKSPNTKGAESDTLISE